jgi:class 3 adenylate cyclase
MLFARFDALAAGFGVEKIKTIGDGYMVAGGVPEPRPDHACAVAEMGLAMLDAAAEVGIASGTLLRLRIGIHSGPIVAGVMGTHKFVYDVWGDTVNTAKSATTRQLIGDAFCFEARGPLDVKGKGTVEAFLLERPDRPCPDMIGKAGVSAAASNAAHAGDPPAITGAAESRRG